MARTKRLSHSNIIRPQSGLIYGEYLTLVLDGTLQERTRKGQRAHLVCQTDQIRPSSILYAGLMPTSPLSFAPGAASAAAFKMSKMSRLL